MVSASSGGRGVSDRAAPPEPRDRRGLGVFPGVLRVPVKANVQGPARAERRTDGRGIHRLLLSLRRLVVHGYRASPFRLRGDLHGLPARNRTAAGLDPPGPPLGSDRLGTPVRRVDFGRTSLRIERRPPRVTCSRSQRGREPLLSRVLIGVPRRPCALFFRLAMRLGAFLPGSVRHGHGRGGRCCRMDFVPAQQISG